jgi:hypothetical protein
MVIPRFIWAYTYELDAPQSVESLDEIEALLDSERFSARERAGTWVGRLVVDDRIAHILVLSDSPDLDLDANKRLERALRALNAHFSLTVPMAVSADLPVELAPKD